MADSYRTPLGSVSVSVVAGRIMRPRVRDSEGVGEQLSPADTGSGESDLVSERSAAGFTVVSALAPLSAVSGSTMMPTTFALLVSVPRRLRRDLDLDRHRRLVGEGSERAQNGVARPEAAALGRGRGDRTSRLRAACRSARRRSSPTGRRCAPPGVGELLPVQHRVGRVGLRQLEVGCVVHRGLRAGGVVRRVQVAGVRGDAGLVRDRALAVRPDLDLDARASRRSRPCRAHT